MRNVNLRSLFVSPLLWLFVFAGCGGGDQAKMAPVSGRIFLDGKPMGDLSISFVPQTASLKEPEVGPGSLAKTDAEGRYSLTAVDGRSGAVVATHIVRIVPALSDGSNPDAPGAINKIRLPKSAKDGSIRFTVPEQGTDQADFQLTSKQSFR
ncbi:MAG: hypothetical protein ACIALR_05740 [Blastopirellula sp. JB062]